MIIHDDITWIDTRYWYRSDYLYLNHLNFTIALENKINIELWLIWSIIGSSEIIKYKIPKNIKWFGNLGHLDDVYRCFFSILKINFIKKLLNYYKVEMEFPLYHFHD